MPKVIKSISLDERTAPIASAKSNFSAWVREQLLAEIAYTIPCNYAKITIWKGDERVGTKSEICNGVRKPPCLECYPEGPPDREDWLAYSRCEIDKEELQARAVKTWEWRTEFKNQAKGRNQGSENDLNEAKHPPSKPKRAYVRRGLTWVWSWIW